MRELTKDEVRILEMIQDHYGFHNTSDKVVWTDQAEAVLGVQDIDGDTKIMVSLSNLAAWCADGTIASDDELRRDWLKIA